MTVLLIKAYQANRQLARDTSFPPSEIETIVSAGPSGLRVSLVTGDRYYCAEARFVR